MNEEESGPDPHPTTPSVPVPRPINPLDLPTSKLSLPCPILTRFLSGGIPIGSITEIVGESGSGKTQLLLHLLLSLPPLSLSLFLNTDSPFPLRRLLSLLQNYQPTPLLDSIFTRSVPSPEDLLSLLRCLRTQNYQNTPIRLLVVDSITSLFRSDFDNTRSDLSRRSALMFSVAGQLKSLARDLGVAVIVTNHVVDVVGDASAVRVGNLGAMRSSGRRVGPALGMAWANCVNTRLFLSRTEEDGDGRTRRRMEVVFAPHLPPSSTEFIIVEEGVFGVRSEGVR